MPSGTAAKCCWAFKNAVPRKETSGRCPLAVETSLARFWSLLLLKTTLPASVFHFQCRNASQFSIPGVPCRNQCAGIYVDSALGFSPFIKPD